MGIWVQLEAQGHRAMGMLDSEASVEILMAVILRVLPGCCDQAEIALTSISLAARSGRVLNFYSFCMYLIYAVLQNAVTRHQGLLCSEQYCALFRSIRVS